LFRVHNVKKFDNTGEDLENLISIETIGLIKAIDRVFFTLIDILGTGADDVVDKLKIEKSKI
jgi:hypothetical protein